MNIDILSEDQLVQMDQLISDAQNIIVISHKSPDGDAIGSCLGWAEYLRSRGKDPTVIVPDQYPDFLQWIPNSEKIVRYDKHHEKCDMLFKIADLVFCLDFNTPSRVNEMEQALVNSPAPKVLIDHHLDPHYLPPRGLQHLRTRIPHCLATGRFQTTLPAIRRSCLLRDDDRYRWLPLQQQSSRDILHHR